FASIDHISNGRAGWNIVTSWAVGAAANYGDTAQPGHAERYARAEEFVRVVSALWDSWSDDAVLDDRAGGRYARPEGIRRIDHAG
ncbi:LLM class flavin-dependent oxidoreductase, partial [Acinetobacter baumannii]